MIVQIPNLNLQINDVELNQRIHGDYATTRA
jgi:hypothetical protein